MNLEQADSVEPFCSDANMRRMGFITRPDALPVGFALDDSPDTAMDSYQIRKESLGPDYKIENFPTTNKWLGLTCAACHTSEIEYGNTLFRIDGGATLADLEGFERGLLGALKATSSDDAKFQRFARLVRGTLDGPNGNPVENEALRARLEAYTGALESEIGHNILPGQEPYGYGRLDAFGAILNKVCGASLEEPENYRPANAPVSYPFLWDTPKLDWVQWNGSVANAMARNVGEVVGVFAHLNLTAEDERYRFRSTANTNNLDTLESWLAELKAPEWNQDILGRFDEDKVRLGKGLFARNCAHCHGVRDANGEFPMTEANPFGGRFIKTHMITAFPPEKDKLGTDPLMISNFVTRLVKPGALGEYLPEELRGAPVAPGAVVLSTAVEKVIRKKGSSD